MNAEVESWRADSVSKGLCSDKIYFQTFAGLIWNWTWSFSLLIASIFKCLAIINHEKGWQLFKSWELSNALDNHTSQHNNDNSSKSKPKDGLVGLVLVVGRWELVVIGLEFRVSANIDDDGGDVSDPCVICEVVTRDPSEQTVSAKS